MNVAIIQKGEDCIVLRQRLTFRWRGRRVWVHQGFASDGASVPRFFWRLICPPLDPRTIRAAIAHDWVYRSPRAAWTRADADEMFLDICVKDGLPAWRAVLAFVALRLFGGKNFKPRRVKK